MAVGMGTDLPSFLHWNFLAALGTYSGGMILKFLEQTYDIWWHQIFKTIWPYRIEWKFYWLLFLQALCVSEPWNWHIYTNLDGRLFLIHYFRKMYLTLQDWILLKNKLHVIEPIMFCFCIHILNACDFRLTGEKCN